MADRNKYFSQKATINYNNGGDMIDVVNNSEYGNYNTYSLGDELGDDGFGFWSRVWNDLSGQTAQQKEFAQQEYLQDKMNEYNLPANQMSRMKSAGINPNTAAGAIAGGGSESAQAPAVASNVGGAANGLASAAGTIASVGTGMSGVAAAKETLSLLGNKGLLMQAQTIKELESANLDHWTATSIATLLPTQSALQQADFYLKLAQYDNTRAQYQLILDEHDLKLQEIRLRGSEADKAAEDARFAKAQTDFFVNHGFRDDSPLDVSLRNSIVTGRRQQASAIGQAIETYNYNAAMGQYKADEQTAYDRGYNSALGEYDADANTIKERTENRNEADLEFQRRLQLVLANRDFTLNLYNSVMELFSSPNVNPESLVKLVINLLLTAGG